MELIPSDNEEGKAGAQAGDSSVSGAYSFSEYTSKLVWPGGTLTRFTQSSTHPLRNVCCFF